MVQGNEHFLPKIHNTQLSLHKGQTGLPLNLPHAHQLKTIFTAVTLFLPLDGGGWVGVKGESKFLASLFITLP